MRLGSAEEDRDLTGGEELANTLCERARAGGEVVELAVEIVEEPADHLGVCGLRAAYDGIHAREVTRTERG
jgi:hypothetical protein